MEVNEKTSRPIPVETAHDITIRFTIPVFGRPEEDEEKVAHILARVAETFGCPVEGWMVTGPEGTVDRWSRVEPKQLYAN